MAKIVTQIPSIASGLHNDLSGLNEGDYQHLTQDEKDNLEYITNKQDSLDADITGIKYPTVNAVIIGNSEVLTSANQYTDSKVASVYKVKGNVNTFADLPSSGNTIGDVWNTLDTGMNYVWTGTIWDALGGIVDVSGKEDKVNKQNSLAVDGTGLKYPTVDAVNTGLSLKLNKGTYTGTAQDLKTDIDNIYQPNVLISSVPPTRSVNTFTYPANQYVALINKTIRTNASSFITVINAAATDYKRVDLIYFKSDNTIAKIVGTESLTVAARPDVPADAVAISFINVFGNVISDPVPVTQDISIQDYFGVEKFKITDYVRFKGFTLEAATKSIIAEAAIPLSAFLDVVNGDDTMALLENANRPYKTLQALLTALPATNGETYTIYITGGTVPVTRKITPRNLRFISYTDCILDFSGVLENDGVTQAVSVFNNSTTQRVWTFENRNIAIQSTYVGQKAFGQTLNQDNFVSVKGVLRYLDWRSTSAGAGSRGSFVLGQDTNINIINLYGSNQTTCVFNHGSVLTGVPIVVVDTFNYQYTNSLVGTPGGAVIDLTIKNAVQVGTTAGLTVNLGDINANRPLILRIGNISSNVAVTVRGASNKIFFSGTIGSLVSFDLINVLNISGVITSSTYLFNSFNDKVVNISDFTGNMERFDCYGTGTVTFRNCTITTSTYLVGRGFNSTVSNLVSFKGFNSINQINTVNDLFKTSGIGSPTIMPIIISLETLTTNALTYGANTSYVKTQSTFKEKLNEVVIRSKTDLINRTLSSTTTYIIDANLVLLTGEYIQVPATGLTIAGYGFDVSSISKNVAGQSIFTSPAGNSGNFVTRDIQYNSGLGSVFNIIDSDGSHAIEFNDVNFISCASLGTFNGYRQFTGTTCGFYSLSDGLTLEGNWSGFKLTNSNVIGFGASGTLFKKGTALVFSNRFYIDLNLQVATGSKICDFADANFTNNKSLQVVNCYTKVNGIVDPTTTAVTFPNISVFSAKAYFLNNIGISNSRYVIPNAVNNDEAVALGQLSDNIVTSATTLSLVNTSRVMYYTYSGSTTSTWTLPTVAGNTKTRFILINTGSNTVTINTTGGVNEIWDSGTSMNTTSLTPGSSMELFNNGVSYIIL